MKRNGAAMSLDTKAIFSPTVLLAVFLMAIIVMMILPVPAWVLDIGLAVSFALAVLIFTVTLFIERPLDFSAFPTILLGTLMLRLSLNVSSTKLIIANGHTGTDAAGHVIAGFANFIMGGSIFLGLVVFLVLLIVNFTVITKGATRMAEVGARFALDGMPGKQLAIDSDLSAGAIDHNEAKQRRHSEQSETTFFGSLDGASKFVKGDAIAGLLITLLNLVAGLAMGVGYHGMPIATAFETFAILTVGDGLVSQFPAVIISISSALLLARGGDRGATDLAIFSQLGRFPAALFTASILMVVFALFPGLPFFPFFIGGLCLGLSAFFVGKAGVKPAEDVVDADLTSSVASHTLGDVLYIDDVHIEFSQNLIDLILDSGTGLDARIANMRTHVASDYGLILPDIRLTDNISLADNTYVVRILGVEIARAELMPDRVLALIPDEQMDLPPGIDTIEPVYGANARWFEKSYLESASLSGITTVTPTEVLATHLLEIVKRNFSKLLTLKSLRRHLDEITSVSDPAKAEENRQLLKELIPDKVPLDVLHAVLRLLLDEQVSIRNLPLILEATAEARALNVKPEAICELVRQRLGFQLVAELRQSDGTVPLVQLAPEWEEAFQSHQIEADKGLDIALPPDLFNRLANNISDKLLDVGDQGIFPALVANSKRRKFLRTLMRARGISNPVLSFEEIGIDARPALVGVVAA